MSLLPDNRIIKKGFNQSSFDFQMGSILLVDKPLEWTSFDVVNKIRYKLKHHFGYKKIKVGHAGTLDPLATGLLIVCTGKFTKIIDTIQEKDKVYSGTFVLGATTPTYDAESDVDTVFPTEHIDEKLIEHVRKSLIGIQDQVPPIFSAIKIKGEAAYKLARRGEEIAMKSRSVQISDFQVTVEKENKLSFVVHCSKGTYIRSLANDFGRKLSSGAYLGSLRREKIGLFDVADAFKIDELIEIVEQLA